MSNKLVNLESVIGYTFQNAELVKTALTHRSAHAKNNERFEFIGDAIVNFVIAEALFQHQKTATEGELSRLRSTLVRGDTLAKIAKEFSLGDYIKLGPGELKSGGHARTSILADTLEALIAAIYLDSDFETCRTTVLGWFESRLSTSSAGKNLKDPKTALQELLQGKKNALPSYQVVKTEGHAHEQMFTVQCVVTGIDFVALGVGSSRRKAEQKAAKSILEHFQKKNESS